MKNTKILITSVPSGEENDSQTTKKGDVMKATPITNLQNVQVRKDSNAEPTLKKSSKRCHICNSIMHRKAKDVVSNE